MLMPTPLPRSTMDFPMPMLSPPDMPTTLDMLPTLLTLPLSILTRDTSEDTLDTLDTVPTPLSLPLSIVISEDILDILDILV